MSDEYQDNQRRLKYEGEYKAWIASLPYAEFQSLEKRGLLESDSDRQQINNNCKSVEDNAFLSIGEDVSIVRSERADILAAVFSRVRASGNPMLYLDCLLSALRVHNIENLTLSEIAHRHGVTKQRVNLMKNRIIDEFDLPPAPGGVSKDKRDEQAARVSPNKPWVLFTAPLDTWRRWWKGTRPVSEWSEQERSIIRNELKWFVHRWLELGGDAEDLMM